MLQHNFDDIVDGKKLYVLDTNVLIHDPTALFQFKEHMLCVPLVVLEELDKIKQKGSGDSARAARQVTRLLASLLSEGSMADGFDLFEASHGKSTGKLFFYQTPKLPKGDLFFGLDPEKADNHILRCAMQYIRENIPVALVTKDVNLRVKALALGVPAQDYRSDRVLLNDKDLLPSGYISIASDFWEFELASGIPAEKQFWREDNKQHCRVTPELPVNSFVIEQKPDGRNRIWRVKESGSLGSVLVALNTSMTQNSNQLINPKNDQQHMATNLLFDNSLDVVTLLGPAGTGKTLLSVACGLAQVQQGNFQEVLITRATVALGEDIGFLPGTETEKMDAWLGGTMRDVYSALHISEGSELKNKVEISSMSFMRGRSFHGKYIIIDEAQNLTKNQVRALLTRAGAGSKVVLTGNLTQIDTPYLDEASSGLAWAVKKLEGWRHAGHLILSQGERSRLASFIEDAASED